MAKNVRFIRTTKERWLKRDSYDPLALYFCEDTNEIFKGDQVYTDGVRIVPTKADLPECPCAADGVVYYIRETRNGYTLSPDRTEWLQTIYAPVEDVTSIPESEIYNTVTTVGAVRDIENAIYNYIDQEITNVGDVGGTFGDVVTSVTCGGIEAGTSLKGKTIKDVLIMLLGVQEAPESVVDYIIDNQIPVYSGLEDLESTEVVYQQLDTAIASHTDQGFYTTANAEGKITNAGYQVIIEGNAENIAQTLAIYTEAKIVTTYKYEPVLSQWVDMGFDETYWVEDGKVTKVVDGKEIVYTTYAYNVELMGDAITATEYWRFEVEV